MRAFRHWTPRYIVDRMSVALQQRRHPDHPWLTDQAVTILSSWLRPGDAGMEFGSGRSTVWTASRVRSLISVEHDRRWFEKVQTDLVRLGIGNVDYRLFEEDEQSTDGAHSSYVRVARECEPETLDYVLVDGIFRDECAVAVLPAIKPGGLLLIDNANWYLPSESRAPDSLGSDQLPRSQCWRELWQAVSTWRRIWTSNGVSDTVLFVKPCRSSDSAD